MDSRVDHKPENRQKPFKSQWFLTIFEVSGLRNLLGNQRKEGPKLCCGNSPDLEPDFEPETHQKRTKNRPKFNENRSNIDRKSRLGLWEAQAEAKEGS